MNQKALDLIKQFEGCKLKAYRDIVGVWTIGYGCTGSNIKEGTVWTKEQSEASLVTEVNRAEILIDSLIDFPLTRNQEAALISLMYNIGYNAFKKSTLVEKINDKDNTAAAEFVKWSHAGGRIVPGLLKRRMAERDLYVS